MLLRRAAASSARCLTQARPAGAAGAAAPRRGGTRRMATTADELRGQSCSLLGGCSSETPKVPAEQLAGLMAALPAWQLAPDQASIRRAFVAKNFMAAVGFVNRVAEVAEAEGHHPDLHLTNYRDVEARHAAQRTRRRSSAHSGTQRAQPAWRRLSERAPDPRAPQVVLSTHAIGGVSMFDLILAAKLDALPVEYSPKWAKAHPEAAVSAPA
ncbi:PDL2 [Scenedesmus sp. PABB004]|nr:PDL2 [Scenedesmus sp. PABB004]